MIRGSFLLREFISDVMLPDVQQMSVIEIEHLVIENADRIRDIGKNRITKKVIAMALGIFHDDVQCRCLFNKIPKLHCLKHAGNTYVFTVDKIYPPMDDVFEEDPDMRIMNRIVGSMPALSTNNEIAFEFLASGDAKCKYCAMFVTGNATCSQTSSARSEDDKPCDEFTPKQTRKMEVAASVKKLKKEAKERKIKGNKTIKGVSRTSTA